MNPVTSPPILSPPSTSRINSHSAGFSTGSSSSSSGAGTRTPTNITLSRERTRSPGADKITSTSESPATPSRGGFLSSQRAGSLEDRGSFDDIREGLEGLGGSGSSEGLGEIGRGVGGSSLRRITTVTPSQSSSISSAGNLSILTAGPLSQSSALTRTVSAPEDEQATTPLTSIRVRPHPRPRATTSTNSTLSPPFRFVPILNPPSPSTRSNLTVSTNSPSPSSTLQSHLYTSGLLASTLSDVQLAVFNRFYRLHRIVLGQSGFFAALLSGGFSEEQIGAKRGAADCEVIELEMDRPMTRAAFEYTLASLYGGGPALVPPPWARTSSDFPLSESFERLWLRSVGGGLERGTNSQAGGSLKAHWVELEDEKVQPTTPTFLLSLLAQATYLEVPSVQLKALQMIQNTITPFTVGQYLGFALGNGLGFLASQTDLNIGCRGLEGVGAPYDSAHSRTRTNSGARSFDPSTSFSSTFTSDSPIFVGPEGERVGEACACWLAKWGGDILGVEEWIFDGGNAEEFDLLPPIFSAHPELKTPELRVWSSLPGGLTSSWIRGVISSDAFFLGSTCSAGSTKGDADSDSRAGGEFERYLFAKRVVELRRKEKLRNKERNSRRKGKRVMIHPEDDSSVSEATDGIKEDDVTLSEDDLSNCSDSKRTESQAFGGISSDRSFDEEEADEAEYIDLFSFGIHYSHLTFKQLQFIAEDISPSSGTLYVPQTVIHRALWQSQDFASKIPLASSSFSNISHSAYSTGPIRAPQLELDTSGELHELGISVPFLSSLSQAVGPTALLQRYFIVPVDDTARINESISAQSLSPSIGTTTKPPSLPSGANNFFGLALESRQGVGGINPGVFRTVEEEDSKRRFISHEPFRFTAEFWGVGDLREKQRLYSQTFFYAGSSYNVYLQRINSARNKTSQLGLYLHRQSQLEAFPVPSRPPNALPQSGPSLLTEVFGNNSRGSTSTDFGPLKSPPYVDKRKEIQAYFSIWCGSQSGTSLTKFGSGPSLWSTSQSWGWKSSSLAASVDQSEGLGSRGRLSSMRCTVVMGLT